MPEYIVIKPKKPFSFEFIKEIIDYRELLYILIKRDISVRYRSTVIGIGWSLLQPLLSSLIFVAVFYYFAKLPIKGRSAFAFYLSGIIPWFFFSSCINRSSETLILHEYMISKVYFPRMILPLVSCVTALYDSFFQVLSFIIITFIVGIGLDWRFFLLFPIYIYLLILSFACALWISILSSLYKDIKHIVPFFTQILFFLTPIFYTYDNIPERFRIYASFNPLIPPLEFTRWIFIPSYNLVNIPIVIPSLIVFFILLLGIIFFQKKDAILPDIL